DGAGAASVLLCVGFLPSFIIALSTRKARHRAVKPANFDYHAPATLDQAIALLQKYNGDARLLAGGQSLLPMMNFRLVTPAALVDLNRIPGLAYIRFDNGMVRIGAMTRHRNVEFSPLMAQRVQLLAEGIRL